MKQTWNRCDRCDYATIYSGDLSKHRRRHKFAVVDCAICRRPFSNVVQYGAHLRWTHGKESPENVPGFPSSGNGVSEGRSSGQKKTTEERDRNMLPSEYNSESRRANHYSEKFKSITQLKSRSKPKKKSRRRKTKEEITNKRKVEIETKRVNHIDDVIERDTPMERKDTSESKIRCVFCEFIAYSYQDLKDHLDCHDGNYERPKHSGKIPKSEKEKLDEKNNTDNTCPIGSDFDERITDTIDSEQEKLPFSNGCHMVAIENVDNDTELHDADENKTGKRGGTNKRRDTSELRRETEEECVNETEYLEDNAGFEIGSQEADSAKYGSGTFSKSEAGAKNDRDKEQGDLSGYTNGHEGSDMLKKGFDWRRGTGLFLEPFACGICGFKTGLLKGLKSHIRGHIQNYMTKTSKSSTNDVDDTCVASQKYRNTTVDVAVQTCVTSMSSSTDECNVHKGSSAKREVSSEAVDSAEGATKETEGSSAVKCTNGDVRAHKGNASVAETLTGRLNKEKFRHSRRFYSLIYSIGEDDGAHYECLICEEGNMFETLETAKEHFRDCHQRLREKVCETCLYCSKPFPR